MFRKWLVTVVAAAFLAVGFWGCEDGDQKPVNKPSTAAKPAVKPGTGAKAGTAAKPAVTEPKPSTAAKPDAKPDAKPTTAK